MTTSKRNWVLFFSFVLFVFILFLPKTSFAWSVFYTTQCGETFSIGDCWTVECNCCGDNCSPCCPCCTECSCSGSWWEYQANIPGCEPDIMRRKCRSVCGPAAECCGCGPCGVVCDAPKVCEECASWQKAQRGCVVTNWGLIKPKCRCNGDCIDKPQNPRYYDNPEYPTDPCDPEKGVDPNNIYLPVKLDWDDVRGWKDGWKDNKCQPCSPGCPECPAPAECYEKSECVHSYVIQIEGEMKECGTGNEINKYEAVLNKSEFVPACSCFFKSGRDYQWRVRACCGADGTNCGQWSDWWKFTTNHAPEPKLPLDPDWNGNKKAEGLPLVEKIEWCDIEDPVFYKDYGRMGYDGIWHYKPLSFKFLLYYADYLEEERKNYKCYPDLWNEKTKECLPKILKPNEALGELFPPPEFSNLEYKYLTKLHSYAWEVAACKDLGATECTDYSQEWKFSIKEFALEPPKLSSPSNDKETPIGLPVLLQWAGSTGTHSYVYEIDGKQGKTHLPNVRFDFPELSLDTVYNWRVKPCWDFDSKDCEDAWSEVYSFKTTGRPPKSDSMKPEGVDIPIPIMFEWENVPGAKSFIFKIQGDGLDLEKVINESKFFLGYPDLHQEKNYSWQIKTCAREGGEVCGQWSVIKNFTTFKLSSPSSPVSPEDGEEIFTYEMPKVFSWDPVPYARYYKYTINYVAKSPEEAGDCPLGKVIEKIVPNNSDNVSLNCLGNYQWQVQACLDKDCLEGGDISPLWNFTLSQKETPGGVGLVPCGRTYDNPKTAWNERETCQIKHLFLMLKIILDFLLLRLGVIILILLIVLSGVLYYVSMGAPETTSQMRSIWKAAGIGYGIILFAWIIISLLLAISGYKLGPWWQIKV